jgi:hypothetical protein
MGPLSRAQLISKVNEICYRVNAKRASITITGAKEFERDIPRLAGYELAAAAEMSELIPPPSMAADWKRVVNGTRALSEITSSVHSFAEVLSDKHGRILDAAISKAMRRVAKAAKRSGFETCAHFAHRV